MTKSDHSAPQSSANIHEQMFVKTEDLQLRASDPDYSVWVSANAGTGKTYVLVNRVLRLMLAGVFPEQILCLTFTKAAAGEMANRAFERLGEWVKMGDDELFKTLEKLLGRTPTKKEQTIARQLFAKALETPGGLKVQTIHGFCESLLKRFPLEADIPPHFQVLDDREASVLIDRACQLILTRAARGMNDENSPLGQALKLVIPYCAEGQFQKIITQVINRRFEWAYSAGGTGKKNISAQLMKIFELPPSVLNEGHEITKQMSALLPEQLVASACDILSRSDKPTDKKTQKKLKWFLNAKDQGQKINILEDIFLTEGKTPRKSIITKAVQKEAPQLYDDLLAKRDGFAQLYEREQKRRVAIGTEALFLIADEIINHYERLKEARPALDYEDLISKTAQLLSARSATQWVLYKLDRGIDHILVDEAQDTSPLQWKIFDGLVGEYFSGDGSEIEKVKGRSIFAVGDEKQSIYSFQGAAPELFIARGQRFARKAKQAGCKWAEIPLQLSFRSTRQILQSVDQVFGAGEAAKALTSKEGKIEHFAHRYKVPGLVEIWPLTIRPKQEEAHAFSPLEEAGGHIDEKKLLAERIARKIKSLIGTKKEWETDEDKKIVRAGDILILLQKRTKFAAPMMAALRKYNIPVAGADRIKLTEQLAVKDMIALSKFFLLPEDDLSLAAVLKSPIFGLDDDDLIKLCTGEKGAGRRGSLWQFLRALKEHDQKYQLIAEQLSQWLSRADLLPPFEFLGKILDCDGVRSKLMSRLGLEAGDALDEFLNLAIRYDDQFPPSLQGFIQWLERSDAEIKRDMEQLPNEVRIMTTHGAKGLESDIVFLPDDVNGRAGSNQDFIFDVNGQKETPIFAWQMTGFGSMPQFKEAKEDLKKMREDERLRLLYVAMTRARNALYICGFAKDEKPSDKSWYSWVEGKAKGDFTAQKDEEGEEIFVLGERNTPDKKAPVSEKQEQAQDLPLPSWYGENVKAEPNRTIPRAPSTLLPYRPPADDEDLKLFKTSPTLGPMQLADEQRFLRGSLTHALLEYLPQIPVKQRKKLAQEFVALRGVSLDEDRRKLIVKEVLTILEDPQFAPLFGVNSLAEVPITARLPSKNQQKQGLLLAGKIDRMAFVGKEIYLVDYKTNRPAPRNVADVAPAYLAQLAAYRLSLAQIYPGHNVIPCLLWTDGAFMMRISQDALVPYEQDLLSA